MLVEWVSGFAELERREEGDHVGLYSMQPCDSDVKLKVTTKQILQKL